VTTGTPEATKKVTLTTRSRLFVFGNVYAGILNCATPYCSFPWVLRVDGEELPNSARRVRANSGESSSSQLMPFGVTEPLEPGTHTITLVRGPLNGTAAMSHGDFDLGAIALGV
jgi:hypothetical protein